MASGVKRASPNSPVAAAIDGEENAAAESGEPGCDDRASRERRASRVERPRRPGERSEDRDRGADPIDAPLAERIDQEGETQEAGHEPDSRKAMQPLPEDDPVEQGDPERNAAHEQGRDARRHRLLRPGEAAVPGEEERPSEDRSGAELARADTVGGSISAGQSPGEQECTGNQMADSHGQKRRQIANRNGDGHEGRAPDEIDRREGKPDLRLETLAREEHDCPG